MAAPVYDTDLTDINLAEATTGWNDVNQAGGGGALSIEIDYAIQGTFAITRAISNTRRGVMYDNGSTITFGNNDHFFCWTVASTPGITDIKSAGGIQVILGTGTGDYFGYYVNGSDTLPGGGMNNYAIHTSSTADLTVGTPTFPAQFFGSQVSINNTAKGDNFACDAIRYGTGFYITEGDGTTPITFSGSAAENDANLNRYGILTAVPGGYALKGRYVVGQAPSTVPTASFFRDQNTSVTFTDTEKSTSDFTQIIFDDPGTAFTLDTITFTAIGTNNKGLFKVNDASTTGSIISTTFNSIGVTSLNANVQVTGSTWLDCDAVYQSSSKITTSNFIGTTNVSSSLVSNNPSLISNCSFEGDGDHHGIEVTTPGNYTFSGNEFIGFSVLDGQFNSALFNNSGGAVTMSIVGGGDDISFRNGQGASTLIEANIQITLTGMKDFTEVRVYADGTTNEIAGIENVVSASVGANDNDFTFQSQAGNIVDIVIISKTFENQRIDNFTIPSTDSEIPIQQSFDRNYINPGGEV